VWRKIGFNSPPVRRNEQGKIYPWRSADELPKESGPSEQGMSRFTIE